MKLWWFSDVPLDGDPQGKNDGGLVVTLTPDTHPTGRAGWSWTPPSDYPDGNGFNLIQVQHGIVDDIRGRLLKYDASDEWVFGVDLHKVPEGSFKPAARKYSGNMCGTRVPGVRGLTGAADPTTVLSWAYDLYNPDEQRLIREDWKRKGFTDVLLSWPDSRGFGLSPQAFGATVRNLRKEGFTPVVMLLSKDFDRSTKATKSPTVRLTRLADWLNPAEPVPALTAKSGPGGRLTMEDLPRLQASLSQVLPSLIKNAPKLCVAWEASLWLMPDLHQALTDWLAPQITPWGGKLYVHFQQGYASWQGYGPNGEELPFAAYWNKNVGLLTGLLHQRDLGWSEEEYQGRLSDVLERFAGRFFCAADSGFNHPFDCVALEITAEPQYHGQCSEAEGNRWGRIALETRPIPGPLGDVSVQGSGNGW